MQIYRAQITVEFERHDENHFDAMLRASQLANSVRGRVSYLWHNDGTQFVRIDNAENAGVTINIPNKKMEI